MKKVNNKGFMIAELLIVTVAILVIFTTIYSNFYPTMGEYEKRADYNDINALYANYYVKVLYLKALKTINNTTIETTFLAPIANATNKYYTTLVSTTAGVSTCSNATINGNLTTFQEPCNELVNKLGIEEVILVSYDTTNVKGSNGYTSGLLKNYIDFLPKYNVTSGDDKLYRLITKTKDGYATSTFYSKVCEPKIWTAWNDWSLIPCIGSATVNCETNNIAEKGIYFKISDWTDMNCTSLAGDTVSCDGSGTVYRETVTEWSDNPETCNNPIDGEMCYSKSGFKRRECIIYDSSNPLTTCNEWGNDTLVETCTNEDNSVSCTETTLYRIIKVETLTACPSGKECINYQGFRTITMCNPVSESCCASNETCELNLLTAYRKKDYVDNLNDMNSPYVSVCN